MNDDMNNNIEIEYEDDENIEITEEVNKNFRNGIISIICFFLILLVVGVILVINKIELGYRFIGFVLMIFFLPLLMLFIYFISNTISSIYSGIKSEKLIDRFVSIVSVFGCISLLIGVYIVFMALPFDNLYDVKKAKVLDVEKNNIITIDYSDFADNKIVKKNIRKPFYINVKKGDFVTIRSSLHNDKMQVVLDYNIGNDLIIKSCIVLVISFILEVVLIITNKKNNNFN